MEICDASEDLIEYLWAGTYSMINLLEKAEVYMYYVYTITVPGSWLTQWLHLVTIWLEILI